MLSDIQIKKIAVWCDTPVSGSGQLEVKVTTQSESSEPQELLELSLPAFCVFPGVPLLFLLASSGFAPVRPVAFWLYYKSWSNYALLAACGCYCYSCSN